MTSQLDNCIKSLKKCYVAPDILDKSKIDELEFLISISIIDREIETNNITQKMVLKQLMEK